MFVAQASAEKLCVFVVPFSGPFATASFARITGTGHRYISHVRNVTALFLWKYLLSCFVRIRKPSGHCVVSGVSLSQCCGQECRHLVQSTKQ